MFGSGGTLNEAARARIVIVGCGFGGLFAARALSRTPADLLVIDRNNYHLFQPLLYQVASAALAPADIAQPIRSILRHQPNARVMLAEVESIDLAARTLSAGGHRIPYDYLILAPGAVDNYFGHNEWHPLAPGMKDVEEATFIRSRLLRCFERAELETRCRRARALLELRDRRRRPHRRGARRGDQGARGGRDSAGLSRRRHAPRARAFDRGGPQACLPAFAPDSSARALAQLHELGVEVRLGEPVTQVLPDGVQVGGQHVRSYNVIWAAGVSAPLLARSSAHWPRAVGALASGSRSIRTAPSPGTRRCSSSAMPPPSRMRPGARCRASRRVRCRWVATSRA